jgi:hypothetical protein
MNNILDIMNPFLRDKNEFGYTANPRKHNVQTLGFEIKSLMG